MIAPAMDTVVQNTMVLQPRLENVVELWGDIVARGVPGDWIETGTYKGGVSLLAAEITRASLKSTNCIHKLHRTIWLADSFKGLPEEKEIDKANAEGARTMDPAGSYSDYNGLEYVKGVFRSRNFTFNDSNQPLQIRFLEGWFNETVADAPVGPIAVLRLDGDLYSSTMDTVGPLYPKVVTGGYVIIDDYGHWLQCARAIDDYFSKELGYIPPLKIIDETGRWFQKPVVKPVNYADLQRLLLQASYKAMLSSNDVSFQGMGHSFESYMEASTVRNAGRYSSINHLCEVGFNAGHSAILLLSSNPKTKLTSFDMGTLPWSEGNVAWVNDLFPGVYLYQRKFPAKRRRICC
jgi:hypothetical protein